MDLGRDVLGYKIIKVANRKVSTWVNNKPIRYHLEGRYVLLRQAFLASQSPKKLDRGY